MVDERQQEQIPDRQRQAWLTEYQACQQDANSTSSNYWTLAGIFIGVSSVLLAGIIYGVLANNNGFNTIDCTLRTLVTIFGVAIIAILVFLWFWLKRVNYLADRYYDRMREIEIKLGMQKNLRVSAIDEWTKLGFKKSSDMLSNQDINRIWKELKPRLMKRLPEDCSAELDKMKKELVVFCNSCPLQHWYKRPSRGLHFIVIFSILITLWLLLILNVLITLTWWLNLIIAILFAICIAIFVIRGMKAIEKE